MPVDGITRRLRARKFTNTSVNPARSTSQALFAGSDLIAQLWLFWLAPLAGGALGALIYRGLLGTRNADLDGTAAAM